MPGGTVGLIFGVFGGAGRGGVDGNSAGFGVDGEVGGESQSWHIHDVPLLGVVSSMPARRCIWQTRILGIFVGQQVLRP
ncbi:MAG TPA: hypothetical protein VGE92_14980 [Steroidobacteraceae bacterium]